MLHKSLLIEKSIFDPPKLMFARIFWKHFHGDSPRSDTIVHDTLDSTRCTVVQAAYIGDFSPLNLRLDSTPAESLSTFYIRDSHRLLQ
jgi:hypothetical protein